MKTKELVAHSQEILDSLKAGEICTLDVIKLSTVTDYMIIASGTSSRHVQSIATRFVESIKKREIRPLNVEGLTDGEWALLDLGDVIVHIMHPEIRAYYQLEKLWDIDSPEIVNQSMDAH